MDKSGLELIEKVLQAEAYYKDLVNKAAHLPCDVCGKEICEICFCAEVKHQDKVFCEDCVFTVPTNEKGTEDIYICHVCLGFQKFREMS